MTLNNWVQQVIQGWIPARPEGVRGWRLRTVILRADALVKPPGRW